MLKLILEAFRDLIIGFLPAGFFSKFFDGEFAFICHPLDAKDAARKYPFTKGISEWWFQLWTRNFWPIIGAQIIGPDKPNGQPIKGWAVVCPLSPAIMVRDPDFGRRMILRTARLCEKVGLKLIALGGYNSIITHDGEDLLGKTRLAVTTGNTYSALLVLENLKKVSRDLSLDLKQLNVAIIGAAGSVGHACSLLIPSLVRQVHLMDTNRKALKDIVAKIGSTASNVKVVDDLNNIKEFDVVITATSTPRAIITAQHVRSGMIFIDASQPKNIAEDLARRDDLLVIDSGIAKVTRLICKMEMGPYQNEVYACLGEAMVLTACDRFENFSVGKVLPDKVKELSEFVRKASFETPPFRNAGGYINNERLVRFKKYLSQIAAISFDET